MRATQQLLFGIFIIMLCALLGMLLSFVGGIIFYGGQEGVSLLYAQQDFDDSNYISLLRFSQVVQSVFMFGVPSLLLAYLYGERAAQYLYLDGKARFQTWLYCLLVFVLALPIVSLSGLINEQVRLPQAWSSIETWMKTSEDFAQFVVQKMVDEPHAPIWINYLVIAVVPALVEELLFRGALQRIFIKMSKNTHWGIWISAFIFSAIHMQFYGFLPRMLLGALFGYIVCYSGSLWVSIALHFINNSFALHFEFYRQASEESSFFSPESLSDVSIGFVLLALAGATLSVYLLRRMRTD
ncbi:MAG: lysostaphin resistance A-like protein [Mangrovibacterium sp.]